MILVVIMPFILLRFIVVPLFFFSHTCFALVPSYYKDPKNNFKAEIEAGFQLNTGNTSSTSFNGRTNLIYDTEHAKQEMTVKGFFSSDKEKTTSEKYELQLQSNYKLSKGLCLCTR